MNEDYKLFNGDSYDVINEIKNLNIEIDHIITDPPYNISKNNNFSTMKNPRKGVDFGDWDKEFDLYSWIKPYTEILNKNGSIIIFCSYRYISHFVDELEKNNLIVKDIIKWEKSNPMPRNITRRYVQDTEFAIWAVKKKSKWIFNKPDDVKYLRANYKTSTVSGKERTSHPTQKSLKLMEDLIKVHTNSHDTILDLFMGSGTTGVAALNLNRKFIGVEIDENYFNIAKSRISSASNLFNL
ncbi:DNA methyltransferase [Staphylococcus epidermidis]|nr:DNA methyltransferase [Staphylococcus epidermidis]